LVTPIRVVVRLKSTHVPRFAKNIQRIAPKFVQFRQAERSEGDDSSGVSRDTRPLRCRGPRADYCGKAGRGAPVTSSGYPTHGSHRGVPFFKPRLLPAALVERPRTSSINIATSPTT
jgi:hypothetical protein